MGLYSPRPSQTERTSTNRETAVTIPLLQTWWHFFKGVLGYGAYLCLLALIQEYALGLAAGLFATLAALCTIALTPQEHRWWVTSLSVVFVLVITGLVYENGQVILDALVWEHWQWFVAPIPLLAMESLFYGRYRFRGEIVDPHGMSPPRSAVSYDGLEYPLRWLVESLLVRRDP